MVEERKRREEEYKRREEELRQERIRRDEETARREEEVRQQTKLLRGLVEGVRERSMPRREAGERDVKIVKLTEQDDIEECLTTFERIMVAYEVPKERWTFNCKLAPQLVGKAQQAYAAMSPDEAQDYDQLKEAILLRYNINEESYRQKFRSTIKVQGEGNRELASRLRDLTDKWMQGCNSVEDMKDRIVMEQLINTMPSQVRVWVKERKPKTSKEAGELADDYVQARGLEIDTHNPGFRKTVKPGTPDKGLSNEEATGGRKR